MGLICADTLKKYMCMKCKDDYSDEPCDPSDCVFYNAITHAPTIDAVPVVRCRECKYWRKHTCIYTGQDEGYCVNPDGLDKLVHPDDFCSYGERKDGGGNG